MSQNNYIPLRWAVKQLDGKDKKIYLEVQCEFSNDEWIKGLIDRINATNMGTFKVQDYFTFDSLCQYVDGERQYLSS